MSSAGLIATSVPVGSALPTTLQGFLNAAAQYLALSGLDDITGIVVSEDTPDSSKEDRLWIEIDDAGRPKAAYIFAQYWRRLPTVLSVGDNRPVNPVEGTLFYDTTIHTILLYNGTSWVTAGGTPGELKWVQASSVSAALAANPGWVQETSITIGTLPTGVYLLKKS